MDTLINDKIDMLIMNSMKAHTEVRTRTLRLMKAAFLEAKTEKNARALDQAHEIQILQKMVKQREDARQQYIDANRIELAKNEFEEMEIIKEFLPKPATKEDILSTFNKLVIDGMDCSKSNMGQCIRMVKTVLPGADGALVASVVKENLV